jgi:hypothetical protein
MKISVLLLAEISLFRQMDGAWEVLVRSSRFPPFEVSEERVGKSIAGFAAKGNMSTLS